MTGYQRKQIDRCAEYPRLTAWEQEFIESLQDKPDSYDLTAKQNHALNKIAQKAAFGD